VHYEREICAPAESTLKIAHENYGVNHSFGQATKCVGVWVKHQTHLLCLRRPLTNHLRKIYGTRKYQKLFYTSNTIQSNYLGWFNQTLQYGVRLTCFQTSETLVSGKSRAHDTVSIKVRSPWRSPSVCASDISADVIDCWNAKKRCSAFGISDDDYDPKRNENADRGSSPSLWARSQAIQERGSQNIVCRTRSLRNGG